MIGFRKLADRLKERVALHVRHLLPGVLGEGDATFEGDFDIPLRVLAYDPDEAYQLLRVEIKPEEEDD